LEARLMVRSILFAPGARLLALLIVGALALAGFTAGDERSIANASSEAFAFDLELVVDGLDRPVQVVDPDDGTDRLFIVEQEGTIRLVRDGRLIAEPFLDIGDRVGCCGERGLLGAAFHPDFADNGLFFVNYTDKDGDTVVARYQVSAENADIADSASATTILTVDQPAANHNGGLLLFGPKDGYLYVGMGDGGGGNGQNSQDPGTLLGKMLRIDVDGGDANQPYAIPADNPLVGQPGARPEIWALGLRNPWRFSFDRATGDLWIGDVGAGGYEEVNFQPAESSGGENYGWNLMEGATCREEGGCDGLITPLSGFGRESGCVVTGGFVYRGAAIPTLAGSYLFADYCSGRVWGLRQGAPDGSALLGPLETGLRISSFGEDRAGELYLVDLAGAIYRLRASPQANLQTPGTPHGASGGHPSRAAIHEAELAT
jgi:glucose/arabinose dehydrogenase